MFNSLEQNEARKRVVDEVVLGGGLANMSEAELVRALVNASFLPSVIEQIKGLRYTESQLRKAKTFAELKQIVRSPKIDQIEAAYRKALNNK